MTDTVKTEIVSEPCNTTTAFAVAPPALPRPKDTTGPDVFYKMGTIATIKQIMSTLSTMATEVDIVFTETGFSIAYFDPVDRLSVVLINGSAEVISSGGGIYKCVRERRIGINVKNFFVRVKVLIDKDEPIIVVERDSACIKILFSKTTASGDKLPQQYVIESCVLKANRVKTPRIDYDCVTVVDSHVLKALLKSERMFNNRLITFFSDDAQTCKEQRRPNAAAAPPVSDGLYARSNDQMSNSRLYLGTMRILQKPVSNGGDDDTDAVVKEEPKRGRDYFKANTFYLSYLTEYCETDKVSDTCTIRTKQNAPLMMKYQVPSVGEIVYYLCPYMTEMEKHKASMPPPGEAPPVKRQTMEMEKHKASMQSVGAPPVKRQRVEEARNISPHTIKESDNVVPRK